MCGSCEKRIMLYAVSKDAVTAKWECPACGKQEFRKGGFGDFGNASAGGGGLTDWSGAFAAVAIAAIVATAYVAKLCLSH